jgi:outer membrane protein TolC
MPNKSWNFLVAVLAGMVAGCAQFDGQAIRLRQAESYSRELAQRTEQAQAATPVLTLDACIRYALENNLDLRAALIDQQIARLNRQTSFSNFLPSVQFKYNYVAWDPNPTMKFGSSAITMHDKRVREMTWNIQMAIFDPSTWFLYSMYTRGEEIAQLVTEYTRQMILLQVTGQYYYCLSLQESATVLQSQLSAAESLEKQLREMVGEGMLSAWQADEAAVLVQARRNDLQSSQISLRLAKADLLIALGLSPMAEIALGEAGIIQAPQGPVEDLIYQAILRHPQLAIADRAVAIEEEKVKLAISAFLPRLFGFATHTTTSDSLIGTPRYWTAGLSGTVSIFNGFASVNQYEAARKGREKAFLDREQQTLTLMAEVLKAHLNLQTTENDKVLAEKNLGVAQAQYNETQSRWKEGLVTGTEMLSVQSRLDQARMGILMAQYQYQVGVAALRQAMGLSPIDTTDTTETR